MSILNLDNVTRSIGEKVILDRVIASLDEDSRIGVIGINGAGKSTLLSVISGETEPEGGSVICRRGLRISYLSQNLRFNQTLSVLDNVASAIHGQEAHWDTEGEARALLLRFGIDQPDGPVGVLSGGQKKRAALIAAILTPCDLLILDEPTNHLDHEMIEWLQDWLRSYRGALLMVTHDRYFLDEAVNTIWELDRAKLFSYPGNYSVYLEKKQERLDYAIAAERKMAALYKQDLKWIMRGARARSTKQKAHIQRFEALRDREKIIEERRAEISSMSSRLGRTIIELDAVSKSYGDHCLFSDFSYVFTRTDRIGFIGRNGCGKSTLLKLILGLLQPDAGRVTVGQTVNFGYFSQENEVLRDEDRVIDSVREVAEYVRTEEGLISASAMCERFLFDSRMQYTPIAKLSGGEKRRLHLLRVLMKAPNVLVLDEPTNDLDIQTLQIFEDYLDHFNGVIVAVSHDRYFLDRVVSRIFSFEEGSSRLLQSEGAYTEYLEHRAEVCREGTGGAPGSGSGSGSGSAPGSGSDPSPGRPPRIKKKLSYKEQREYDSLETRVDELTARSEALDALILESACDFERLASLTAEKSSVDAELEASIERYLELQEMIEELEKL